MKPSTDRCKSNCSILCTYSKKYKNMIPFLFTYFLEAIPGVTRYDVAGQPLRWPHLLTHNWILLKARISSHIYHRQVNTLRPRQNGRHFADDTFKSVFLNENVRVSIKISLKFVPKGPIDNMPALVQIMAWRRLGDKPLSEPMMVRSLMHICVTRPQWVQRCYKGTWELIQYTGVLLVKPD